MPCLTIKIIFPMQEENGQWYCRFNVGSRQCRAESADGADGADGYRSVSIVMAILMTTHKLTEIESNLDEMSTSSSSGHVSFIGF